MSLILKEADWNELWQQAPKAQLNNQMQDDFGELQGIPESLGQGYSSEIELLPGVSLNLLDCKYHQDLMLKVPVHDHTIQMMILLSGSFHNTIHSTFSEVSSYLSGSGISPAYEDRYLANRRLNIVNVDIEPEVLKSNFLGDDQLPDPFQKQLFQEEDWKISFYPKVTPAMRSLAHQMWNAPYRGAIKRMYLQGKVFELLALHLALISEDSQQAKSPPRLMPKTVNALHHAKDILETQLEQPPSLPQLAEQVGVSQRTLQKGFPLLFKTTVVSYLTQQRLDRAEMLLRDGKHTVAEVATKVGYNNMGYFSVAFKGQFGITPSQCLAGKKVDF